MPCFITKNKSGSFILDKNVENLSHCFYLIKLTHGTKTDDFRKRCNPLNNDFFFPENEQLKQGNDLHCFGKKHFQNLKIRNFLNYHAFMRDNTSSASMIIQKILNLLILKFLTET